MVENVIYLTVMITKIISEHIYEKIDEIDMLLHTLPLKWQSSIQSIICMIIDNLAIFDI